MIVIVVILLAMAAVNAFTGNFLLKHAQHRNHYFKKPNDSSKEADNKESGWLKFIPAVVKARYLIACLLLSIIALNSDCLDLSSPMKVQ